MSPAATLPHIIGFQRLSDQQQDNTLVVERGDGVFVFDAAGRDYLEASASFYVAALGYSNAEVVEASRAQMARLPYYTSAMHRTPRVAIELAEKLVAICPARDTHVIFASSGSEANDFLVKMMMFQSVFQGRPRRTRFISRRDSYHGGTLASASLTGGHHAEFGLPLPGFLHVSQPDYHGNRAAGETESEFTSRLARELNDLILAQGADTVAAFFAEPASFSAGLIAPPRGYFDAVSAVLEAHDVALVADEVITGFGRTGALFGCETFGIRPTHVTLAKALTSGYFPLSAAAIGPELYEDLSRGADEVGIMAHAATSAAHPVGAAVALKVIEIIERDGLVAHAARAGDYLHRALAGKFSGHPWVGNIRHIGLGCALDMLRRNDGDEVIADDPDGRALRVYEQALKQRLIVRRAGRSLVIAPPLIITEREIDELVRRLEVAFANALYA